MNDRTPPHRNINALRERVKNADSPKKFHNRIAVRPSALRKDNFIYTARGPKKVLSLGTERVTGNLIAILNDAASEDSLPTALILHPQMTVDVAVYSEKNEDIIRLAYQHAEIFVQSMSDKACEGYQDDEAAYQEMPGPLAGEGDYFLNDFSSDIGIPMTLQDQEEPYEYSNHHFEEACTLFEEAYWEFVSLMTYARTLGHHENIVSMGDIITDTIDESTPGAPGR